MHEAVTLGAEVTKVSTHCVWLLLGDEELAVSSRDFPWCKKATIEQLSDVQRPAQDHLFWLQLDVDLCVESIRRPDSFPLVSRSAASDLPKPEQEALQGWLLERRVCLAAASLVRGALNPVGL